jgi:hypothetical protein
MFQGLKPLAQSLGPFGTKTRTPVHIFEATPPFEDENDGEPPGRQPSSAPDSSIRVKSDPFGLAALNLPLSVIEPWMGFCRLDASSMERDSWCPASPVNEQSPSTPRTIVSPRPCSSRSALLVSDLCGLCVFVVKFCPQLSSWCATQSIAKRTISFASAKPSFSFM